MSETLQVETARIPDRDRLLLDARAGVIYIRPPLS